MRSAITKGLTCTLLAIAASLAAQVSPKINKVETRDTGVEVVARLEEQPEHVTVTHDGRIIFSVRSVLDKTTKLYELKPDGTSKAFPNPEWGGARRADGKGMTDIIGIASHPEGAVVILDRGNNQYPARLIVWDTKANALLREVPMPARQRTDFPFLQDLAMDLRNKAIYLAARGTDKTRGALMVVRPNSSDIKVFTLAKVGVNETLDVSATGQQPQVQADKVERTSWSLREGLNVPLALDPQSEWLYFGGQAGDWLARVRTADLSNPDMTAEVLRTKIEKYGDKPVSRNMAVDANGTVYFTEENSNSIGVLSPDRGLRRLATDAILNWPDDIVLGPDGYLYVTVNHLKKEGLKGDVSKVERDPYLIVRVKTLPASASMPAAPPPQP